MGKGKGGWGLFIVGFFTLSVYNFLIAFENQNDGCDKQQNIFFSYLRILSWKHLQEHVLLHGHGDYEKIR